MLSAPSTILALANLAKNKLSTNPMSKPPSLRRWVLLKNSVTRSQPQPPTSPSTERLSSEDDEFDVTDSFMFPDASNLGGPSGGAEVSNAEDEWLDSLLETLEDDESSLDDDDSYYADSSSLSDCPLSSSPSGELSDSQVVPSFYPNYPFVVPYPPNYAPMAEWGADSNMSVPEAIEDTSDDESDAPISTPSLVDSPSSSSVSEAPLTLPEDFRQLPLNRPKLRLFVDSKSPAGYHYNDIVDESDPLPFAHDEPPAFNLYHCSHHRHY